MDCLAKQLTTRTLADGVVIERSTVLVRRRDLRRLLKLRPAFRSYSRDYDPDFRLYVLTEPLFGSGQLAVDPAHAAKAGRDAAEWGALLDESIEVVSEEGVG